MLSVAMQLASFLRLNSILLSTFLHGLCRAFVKADVVVLFCLQEKALRAPMAVLGSDSYSAA